MARARRPVAKQPALPAKLSAPRPSRALERPRLFAALDRARRSPIVWITGPAGAGKTTLVTSYLAARRTKAVYYRVDRLDGDRGRVFQHLTRALESLVPKQRGKLPKPTSDTDLFTVFSLRYFEALFALLPEGSALVFDDYHDAPPSAKWEELLADAARSMQRPANIVVISRREPARSLIRHELDEAVAIIDGSALRLTAQEARGLARRRFPRRRLDACKGAIEGAHATTGGWIAAFVLFMESACASGSPASGATIAPERVFDYIAAEIFDRVDPRVRDALLRTSILPDFTLSSADALLGEEGASRVLLGPFGLHHFVEHQRGVAGTDVVHRYHPLFRAFLLHRAEETFSAEDLGQLRRAAARLLVTAERPDEAIELYRRADDHEQIAALALAEAPALMKLGRVRTLADWLAMVPRQRAESDPWLLYWEGHCRLGGDPKDALPMFERAHALFTTRDERDGADLAWAACVRAIVFDSTHLGDLDPWLARAPAWAAIARPDRSQQVQAQVIAAMVLGLTYRGNRSDVARWAGLGLSLVPRLTDATLQTLLASTILYYCTAVGDLGAASALVETLRGRGSRKHVDPLVSVFVTFAEAAFAWLTGDEQGCSRSVVEGVAMARIAGASHLSDRMLVYGCLAAIGRADAPAARHYVEELGRIAASGRPFDVASHHYALGHEALFRGDLPRAAHAAKTALSLVTDIGIASLRMSALLLAANVAFEAQRVDEARSLLRQAQVEPDEPPDPPLVSRLLLEAAVAFAQGARAEGRAALERGFRLGRQLGLYNAPWPKRARLAELCVAALEEDIEPRYARELARRLGLFPAEPPLFVAGWPWRVRVFTLGHFDVVLDPAPVDVARAWQPGPLRLLKALVALRAYGGRKVATALVIDALWPDLEGDAGNRALDTTLHRLRRLLGSDEALEMRHGQLGLRADECWVDTWAFERLVVAKNADPDALLSLYAGPFLGSEPSLGWIRTARQRERDRFERGILRIARELDAAGRHAEAIDLFRRALGADDEALHLHDALAHANHRIARHTDTPLVRVKAR